MQGRIAMRSVDLKGFDGWSHASAFEPFARSFPENARPDWAMNVRFVPHVDRPTWTPQGRGKRTVWTVDEFGNGELVHLGGAFSLAFNTDFSRCTLSLREGLPDRDVLRYVYTAQMFSYYLLSQGDCCMHSAALEKDGRALLLVGPSGVGKSTMATRCQQADSAVRVLCEDLPAICFENGRPIVYGTPFCGDDTRVTNASAPLDAVVLLRQSPYESLAVAESRLAAATLTEAMPYPVYCPSMVDAALMRIQDLFAHVPIMVFDNRGTEEAGRQLLAAWSRGF